MTLRTASLLFTLLLPSATLAQETPDLAADAWQCFGSEPFWTLYVEGDLARWIAPGEERGVVERYLTGRHDIALTGDPPTGVWIGDGPARDARNRPVPMALFVEDRACLDADAAYPLYAWVTHPEAGLVPGCCAPQSRIPDESLSDITRWELVPPTELAAVATCLDAAGVGTSALNIEARGEEGVLSIIVETDYADRLSCLATPTGNDLAPYTVEIDELEMDNFVAALAYYESRVVRGSVEDTACLQATELATRLTLLTEACVDPVE